jgi:hypothetical protein
VGSGRAGQKRLHEDDAAAEGGDEPCEERAVQCLLARWQPLDHTVCNAIMLALGLAFVRQNGRTCTPVAPCVAWRVCGGVACVRGRGVCARAPRPVHEQEPADA